jgi:hypothetical protein
MESALDRLVLKMPGRYYFLDSWKQYTGLLTWFTHFEEFLHEAPPSCRLMDGKKYTMFMKEERYGYVNKNRRKDPLQL